MPVVDLFELLLDDVSDEQDLASAQKVGEHESGHGGHEHHRDTAYDSRKSQRENNLREGLEFICPQILGCLDHA